MPGSLETRRAESQFQVPPERPSDSSATFAWTFLPDGTQVSEDTIVRLCIRSHPRVLIQRSLRIGNPHNEGITLLSAVNLTSKCVIVGDSCLVRRKRGEIDQLIGASATLLIPKT